MSDQRARDLETMVALFQSGTWNGLSIESPALSLLLSRDAHARPAAPGAASATQVLPNAGAAPAAGHAEQVAPPAPTGDIDPRWSAITAPNLGTFYRSPKPGAPPFVEVGQKVDVGAEVCLIEVMKLFTSVRAASAGTVRHIAVADAELVEGGQALIYIDRD